MKKILGAQQIVLNMPVNTTPDDIQSIDACNLPKCFLGGQAPLLSVLRLRGCGLAYDSPLLRNVTSFHVFSRGSEATLESRIFEALRYMPLLEYRYLEFSSIRPDTPLDTQVAFLPSLRILKLSGLSYIGIFNHVSFPPTTSVKIACYDQDGSLVEQDPDWDAFWATVPRITSFYPGEARILKMAVVDVRWHIIHLANVTSLFAPVRDLPQRISVVIDWREAWQDGQVARQLFSELLKAAFYALPMPALEILHLGAFPRYSYLPNDILVDTPEPQILWSSSLRVLITRTEYCARFLSHQPDDRCGLHFRRWRCWC